jgi:hypothetical protein
MPESVQKAYGSYNNKTQLRQWSRNGKAIPVPHAVKQGIINKYRNKHNINILVESGTYLGDMVWAQRNNFDKIYSIELSKELVLFNRKRFKKYPSIEIIQGDSGKILPTLVKELEEETLFWLDGHYSGEDSARGDKDCPVIEEVKAILSTGMEHVIIMSDARCFTGQRDFPTLEGISSYITSVYPKTPIHIENDCIIVELKITSTENV